MSDRVVALGIDAPNEQQLKRWIADGELPTLKRLLAEGASGHVKHEKQYRNERCWDIFLNVEDSDSCGSKFIPKSYDYYYESLQRTDDCRPFYALGDDYRVCAFDLLAPLHEAVNGIQISGWGSELNASKGMSSPPELIEDILAKYGADPKTSTAIQVEDFETHELESSVPLPSVYDLSSLHALKERIEEGIRIRTAICKDLLERESWDLFIALFSETHTANHLLWHLGEESPLSSVNTDGQHALLDVYKVLDSSIGQLADQLDAADSLLVYTIDEARGNAMDVPSMALLPELLYRWNNPGQRLLTGADLATPLPPLSLDYREHWKREVWNLATDTGKRLLESPDEQEARADPLSWNVANWYKHFWPGMKAFALPSVADGYVRLNVKGREGSGIIDPANFANHLEELATLLETLRFPRSGEPAVRRVLRVRENPNDFPEVPPDLIVCWNTDCPIDVIDSQQVGERIGPLPFFRTGGHVNHGEEVSNQFILRSKAVTPGLDLGTGKLQDLSATLLDLMGVTERSGTATSLLNREVTHKPAVSARAANS